MVHVKDLPESFYAFRDNIDYNADHLSENFAYKRYLFFHFDKIDIFVFVLQIHPSVFSLMLPPRLQIELV